MNYQRLRFNEETSIKLGNLYRQTGLTPNLLARIGFCLSLKDPGELDLAAYQTPGSREIDRHTLTGDKDLLYVLLLQEWCAQKGISDEDEVLAHFRAHMNRGVYILDKEISSVKDLARLMRHAARLSPVNQNGNVQELHYV